MKSTKMIVLGFLVLILVLGVFFLRRTRSVLYRFTEIGTVGGGPHFIIFNPFRDKIPENEAEKFLMLFRKDCETATLHLKFPATQYTGLCEKEVSYEEVKWTLSDREDNEQYVKLHYHVKRDTYNDYDGKIWVDVKRIDDEWKVENVAAVY